MIFPFALITTLLPFLAVAGTLLLGAFRFRVRGSKRTPPRILLRLILSFGTLWLGFIALDTVWLLSTAWPLPLLALTGAAVLEGLAGLYRFERGTLSPRSSLILMSLRLVAALLLIFILAEPVLERTLERRLERYVVLLVDQSASMDLSDPQRDSGELLDLAALRGLISPADPDREPESVMEDLDEETREQIEALREVTRNELVQTLLEGVGDREGLPDRWGADFAVRVIPFASSPGTGINPLKTEENENADRETPSDRADSEWARMTNLASPLDAVLEDFSTDQLAGIFLISDFRDTARSVPEAPTAALARRNVPVHPVLTGSVNPRPDLAVTRVDAPQTVFKGERVRVDTALKLYGAAGKPVRASLLRGDEVVDETVIEVPEDNDSFRTEVRFTDEPDTEGILTYEVHVEEIEGEARLDNNRWTFRTAVSDDRTNVLLADRRPRWEFQYLRNLFYGRDKSVHLQYVLTDPDFLDGKDEASPVIADASRPFGDATATRLPETLEQWRQFDLIILGDLSPEILTGEQIGHIREVVSERGTALVVMAGPVNMPHRFQSRDFQDLLPVRYVFSDRHHFTPPEPAYEFRLTADGLQHPVPRLSSSISETVEIWNNLPSLQWRFPVDGVKRGSTILAYAVRPEDRAEILTADASPEETARRIRERNEQQETQSLIVTRDFGLGRVMMLNFDRTWRLRYRVGDTYHHRFWGQIATWGAGENLRAGDEFLRLGTDAVRYGPDERVRVTARALSPDYTPLTRAQLYVEVFRGEELLARHSLEYREQSQGLYDAVIGPFPDAGLYRIRLGGRAADEAARSRGLSRVETEFYSGTAGAALELAELSADAATAARIARASDTEVLRPGHLFSDPPDLGEGTTVIREEANVTFWDHPLIFLLFVSIVTAEWILRRKGGLV